MKDVWSYWYRESGGQYVMTAGIRETLKSSVDSLVFFPMELSPFPMLDLDKLGPL